LDTGEVEKEKHKRNYDIMKQKKINTFIRKYFDLTKTKHKNIICHDPNTTPEHRRLVNEICEWLRCNNITFYTRVFMKWGNIADIVAPELIFPIIEVRNTEEKKDKKYDENYKHLIQFIDVSNPFKIE